MTVVLYSQQGEYRRRIQSVLAVVRPVCILQGFASSGVMIEARFAIC